MAIKKTETNFLHNKEIKLGYRIVKIKVTPPNFNKGHMCEEYGQYEERTSTIDLQDKLNARDEVNTFLHELLHAILSDMGETGKGGTLSDEDTEEKFVLTEANALTALLFDNKWFIKYLYNKVMQ